MVCTQTDAKKTCAVSLLQSSLPRPTVGTLVGSSRIHEEMKADLVDVETQKLAVVVWSAAAWANRKDLSSTLGFISGVTTTRILQGGRHVLTPFHHRSGKSKRKARSSLSAEVQALADDLGNADETVQRVDGVLEIDAKAIGDSM